MVDKIETEGSIVDDIGVLSTMIQSLHDDAEDCSKFHAAEEQVTNVVNKLQEVFHKFIEMNGQEFAPVFLIGMDTAIAGIFLSIVQHELRDDMVNMNVVGDLYISIQRDIERSISHMTDGSVTIQAPGREAFTAFTPKEGHN